MLRWLLIAVLVVIAWWVLSYLAGVLGPILAALGIAYMLNPVLDRLVKRGVSRSVGAAILLVTFIGLVVLAISIAAPAIADQLSDFVRDLPRMVTNLSTWVRDRFGVEIPHEWRDAVNSDHLKETLGASSGPIAKIASAAVGGVFSVLGVFAEALLVPVFSFYFLVDWPNLLRRIDHMIPPRRRHEVRDVMTEIDRVVAGWVRGQAIVTSILAVLYAVAFTIVGMPLSVPIGLLVGTESGMPTIVKATA